MIRTANIAPSHSVAPPSGPENGNAIISLATMSDAYLVDRGASMIGVVISNSTIILNALANSIEGSFQKILKLSRVPDASSGFDWDQAVILIDLDTPATSIPALLGSIPRPALSRTIVLTKAAHEARDLAPLVGEVGAILPHSSDLEEVGLVARLVRSGLSLLPSEMIHFLQTTDPLALSNTTMSWSLTARENAVLAHVAQGSSNKAIARALGIHDTTVRVHVRSLLRKIGVTNRTQAALMVANELSKRGSSSAEPRQEKESKTPQDPSDED